MIVGLCGPAGVGKTTAAAYLVSNHGYVRRRFAGPLKAMMLAFGLSERQVEGDLKAVPADILGGKTPRQAMQWLGTEWGRDLVAPDLWLRAWLASLPATGDVVCDDVRFPNEVAAIRDRGGVIVQLTGRGGIPGSHISEGFMPSDPLKIDNSGGWPALYASLDTLLADLALKQAA